MYDAIVVGAGPAGATFARLAGARLNLLVLERRPLDTPYHEGMPSKCCGGLLAPDAQVELARHGFALNARVLCQPQTFLVRALDLASRQERHYQRHYVNLNREEFDRFLFGKITGCQVRTGCSVTRVKRSHNGFEVQFRCKDRLYTERARHIVAADGGSSVVRRRFDGVGPGTAIGSTPCYAAIQEWIKAPDPQQFFGAYFDQAITDYYAWTIPKDGYVLLGAALPPGRAAIERFTALKERLIAAGVDVGGSVQRREGAILQRPRSLLHTTVRVPGVAFLGEAGGLISPSSCEGISFALKSGLALAQAVNESGGEMDRAIPRYAKAMSQVRLSLLAKMWKGKVLYTPLTRHFAMASSLKSVEVFKQG